MHVGSTTVKSKEEPPMYSCCDKRDEEHLRKVLGGACGLVRIRSCPGTEQAATPPASQDRSRARLRLEGLLLLLKAILYTFRPRTSIPTPSPLPLHGSTSSHHLLSIYYILYYVYTHH